MSKLQKPPFSCLLLLLPFVALSLALSSDGDQKALLEFKSSVTDDPWGFLSNWNPKDTNPCFWNGVTCDPRSRRVVSLHLSSNASSCSFSFSSGNPNSISFPCLGFELNDENKTLAKLMKGKLSPSLGNLTQLRVLSIGFNGFSGALPLEIGNLRFLEILDLGFNNFEGGIPLSISNCIELQEVSFSGNQLNGTVPTFFAGFLKLRTLSLSFNVFTGVIPKEFGENCSVLEHLHLAGNHLSGSIPPNLGNCSRLRSLILFSNKLEDGIPPDLGRLQMLESLDVSRNSLSGIIPSDLGNCKQLELLVLKNDYNFSPVLSRRESSSSIYSDEFNFFGGELPDALVSLPNLRVLWAPSLNLEGTFPRNWGSCTHLQMVNLSSNYFTGEIPASLGQCKSMYFLDLSSNRLSGRLSEQIPVPCMLMFNVSGNSLSGLIPNFLHSGCLETPMNLSQEQMSFSGAYSSLFYKAACTSMAVLPSSDNPVIFHDFSFNQFVGPLPLMQISPSWLAARPLYGFLLRNNYFEGNMLEYPFDLCLNLDSLVVNFGDNRISGELPWGMGSHCKCMKQLDLAGNAFIGLIPLSFAFMDSLISLDLSRNKLQGQIPIYFGKMKDLRYLFLSGNNFTGKIPHELAQLRSLEVLELSSNSLSGEIPNDFTKLGHITVLRLDVNSLSGQIPKGFNNTTSLSVFNVSFNNLSGSLSPNLNFIKCENVQGNPNLNLQPCRAASLSLTSDQHSNVSQPTAFSPTRSVPRRGKLNPIEIASIVSASAIVFVLGALVILLTCIRKHISESSVQGSGRKEVVTCNNIGVQLTYENVVKATGNFSVQNCIGNGGFGATYKAEVIPGVVVAIKRLSIGRFQGDQQFGAEIRTLGRVQHPNLVTLIGYHVSEAEMFLIYNYLPGGNLERFIQDRSKRAVDWSMLHKIALDIARALAYLHDECVPRVLHRDIKPSNILLDKNYNAYLSDFGLARLLGTSETHATTDVAGTFGYVAPEYAMTCRVSDKADVYSYGVVLLELISDKKALDPSFSCYGNGFNIVAWASMLLRQGRAREFFTAGLWDLGPHDDLIETLRLAVVCTGESLSTRPSMKQVAQRLKRIQPPTC